MKLHIWFIIWIFYNKNASKLIELTIIVGKKKKIIWYSLGIFKKFMSAWHTKQEILLQTVSE